MCSKLIDSGASMSANYLKTLKLIIVAFILITACLAKTLYVSTQSQKNPKSPLLIENQEKAILAVKNRISQIDPEWGQYVVDGSCVSYVSDDVDIVFFQVELREIHSGKEDCPGDPNTIPLLALFKVQKDNGDIFRYDIINDVYNKY